MLKKDEYDIVKKIKDIFKGYTLLEQIEVLERINKYNRQENSIKINDSVRKTKMKIK